MFSTAFALSTTYQKLSDLLFTAGYRGDAILGQKGYLFNRDTSITLTVTTGDTIPTGLDGATMPARTSIPFVEGLDTRQVWIKSASGTPTIEIGIGLTPPAIPSTTNTLGAATGTSLAASGAITSSSPSAGIGYATGAGGSATQGTSKATTVAFNAECGEITTHAAQLNAATIVSFTFTNTSLGSEDLLVVNHVSGGTIGAYSVEGVSGNQTGTIYIRNNTAGNLSEALVLRFAIIKGVIT